MKPSTNASRASCNQKKVEAQKNLAREFDSLKTYEFIMGLVYDIKIR